ncbi:Peptide alpha-N-acetyltransferase [Handroanthus impetiginosus]|uniref:Peptide alpha-N-acetyltransferase n=1 Tax=Handroanthus impetiginosus TaxID=429701 RepID=A0A2G9GX71_9LAMI|nr:Peptide alpha-N-acetyltransferase [Handroanthus impetiginosus]
MAETVSISISPRCHPHRHFLCLSATNHRYPYLRFPKRNHCNLSFSVSASHFSSSSSSSSLQNPLQTGRFLTNEELEKLELLGNYSYHQQLESGLLWVRLMRAEEMDMTVTLLSESFAESMMMGTGYVKLLEFLVKNYLIERRETMPHSATLLGIYRENGEEDFELAGTVELTFNKKGANANPPTPNPPKNSPYICNMAVRKPLRRRGIGWHLLKAGEELITKMSSSREVYLHCRIIDEGPFNMYMKAGYGVVKTDSILTLLTFQRRRHLMRKELPISENDSAQDISNEQLT